MYDDKHLCLDPSCFASLENWANTKRLLGQSEFNGHQIIIPETVFRVINYPPKEKFENLAIILRDWNFKKMTEFEQGEYVRITRYILEEYRSRLSVGDIDDLKKIGEDSIEIDLLIQRFRETTGKILFQVMAISWKHKAKIIAFSERTFDFMKEIGTEVKRGTSPVKKKVKEKAGIQIPLWLAVLYMDAYDVLNFVKDYQIEGIPLHLNILPTAGVIILANEKTPLVNTKNKFP